jgi:hypothetical protein
MYDLKGQLHGIFGPWFFHQSTPSRALIHGLKPFRIWLRIRRDNRFESRKNRFSGVNDPAKIVSPGSMTPHKFKYSRFFSANIRPFAKRL